MQSEPPRPILSKISVPTSLASPSLAGALGSAGRRLPLKILAIETSVRSWRIALLEHDNVLTRPRDEHSTALSRALLPTIQSALDECGWSARQIELIAVTRGPGTFTGLRVGITAAKTLAYALACPLVACNTLEVIAAGVAEAAGWPQNGSVLSMMDAQRGEFIAGLFRIRGDWSLEAEGPSRIMTGDELDSLPIGATFAGPALAHWTPSSNRLLADRTHWQPDPRVLGRLAERNFSRGIIDDPFSLVPEYARPSYAEER